MHATSSRAMTIFHCDFILGHRAGLKYQTGLKKKKLEEAQQATVESSLQKVLAPLKSPNFSQSQVIDSLLSFKLIPNERNHAKAGFNGSVFQAMPLKATIPDDDFKRYLEVLLGNKDDEKVMELMSKAEKAMQNSRLNRRDSGRRCHGCVGYGYFQATCPFRKRYEWSPPSRRPNRFYRGGARGGQIGWGLSQMKLNNC